MARRRRSPEVARQEILDAAERVFVAFQPDQVGLKEVSREAGVSHALITHYFGTYAGLVEATLERRITGVREKLFERLEEPGVLDRPEALLGLLFDALADPVYLRLTRWMFASERPSANETFAFRREGLQMIAHRIAATLADHPTKVLVDKVEMALLTAVSAAYGYAMGKHAFAGALGRKADRELDRQLQATVAAMLRAHLQTELAAAVRESR